MDVVFYFVSFYGSRLALVALSVPQGHNISLRTSLIPHPLSLRADTLACLNLILYDHMSGAEINKPRQG